MDYRELLGLAIKINKRMGEPLTNVVETFQRYAGDNGDDCEDTNNREAMLRIHTELECHHFKHNLDDRATKQKLDNLYDEIF